MRLWWLLALLLGLALAGCEIPPVDSTPVSTPVLTAILPTPTVRTVFFPPLMRVHSIHIQDNWDGLDSVAPLRRLYELTQNGDQFTGQASFSVGGHDFPACTATEAITVSGLVVDRFLIVLEGARLEEGTYTPNQGATDHYPDLKIDLQLPSETLEFFSTSQGDGPSPRQHLFAAPWECCNHTPWALKRGNATYVINSAVPDEALAVLDSDLRRDVLYRLVDQGRSCK